MCDKEVLTCPPLLANIDAGTFIHVDSLVSLDVWGCVRACV